MTRIKLFFFTLSLSLPYILYSQAIEEKQRVKISATAYLNQALLYDGHVQVREHSYEGDLLELKETLGMQSWIKPGGTLSANFYDKNIFEFSYGENFFKGTKVLKEDTWYNGTNYITNSEADIKRTIYKSFEWVWKARLHNTPKHNFYFRTAIAFERLKFYVDANIAANSPIRETFEKFWKQQQPLPALGVASEYRLSKSLLLKSEIGFTYLPKVKTWMNEGGRISMAQSNVDATSAIQYRYKFLTVDGGIWFKHFKLLEESTEDKNRFLINGGGYRAGLTFTY